MLRRIVPTPMVAFAADPTVPGGRRSRRAALRVAGLAVAALGLAGRAALAHARQATPAPAAAAADSGWHAAIRRSRLRAGVSSEEVARIVRDGFVPLITAVPGFVAYYVIDTGQGGHVTISVFSDPRGPAESSRRSAEWVPGALGGLIEGPATVLAEGPVQVYAVADTVEGTPPA